MACDSGQAGEKEASIPQTRAVRASPCTDALVVITPEMVAAGVGELREKIFGQDFSDIVYDVFLAMALASPLADKGSGFLNQGSQVGKP